MLATRGPDLLVGCVLIVGCKLDPRPLALFSGGDEIRIGGCTLADLLTAPGEPCSIKFWGIVGTGGASWALGRAVPRPGDGSRKVLSDIDPELKRRSNCDEFGRPGTDPAAELVREEVELLRRLVRFVWTSATLVGVVGRERRAVAAAAAERFALDLLFARNACAAAVVAEGSAVDPLTLKGCIHNQVSTLYKLDRSHPTRDTIFRSRRTTTAREKDIPGSTPLSFFCQTYWL